MPIARTILSFVLLIAGAAFAQGDADEAASRSVTYEVTEVDGSGVSGAVFVGEYGPRTTVVVVSVDGTSAGVMHPAHFHRGDCGSGGGIQVPLSPVDGDTGLSVTLTDAAYDDIVEADHYLNVHLSPEQIQTIVACGEVGTGVQAAVRRTADTGETQDGSAADQDAPTADRPESESEQAQPGDAATPDTASYGLFPVQGSDIRGQVQLTELLGSGTKFVVTLVGIEPDSEYGLALYEGDCGPDRPKVRDLRPVGEVEADPYASVTETQLPFRTITEGDYFMYVFRTPEMQEIVACGEVGMGANR